MHLISSGLCLTRKTLSSTGSGCGWTAGGRRGQTIFPDSAE